MEEYRIMQYSNLCLRREAHSSFITHTRHCWIDYMPRKGMGRWSIWRIYQCIQVMEFRDRLRRNILERMSQVYLKVYRMSYRLLMMMSRLMKGEEDRGHGIDDFLFRCIGSLRSLELGLYFAQTSWKRRTILQ